MFCTNEVSEVHVKPFTVAKVGVHPVAMQDHLRHTFFYHLVILRPVGRRI